MEELIEIVFLGIIQGLTEFLPVSSSGHLVLGQYFLGIKSPGNSLEILFHIGTLGSVVFVFFNDIKDIILKIDKKPTRKLLIFISVATLPAMIIGFLFRHDINRLFENINSVGYAFCITGLILVFSSLSKKKNVKYTFASSILIGLAQAVAIIPGISRSGFTITASLLLGISPKKSAKFSFLISMPIIFGAGLLGAIDIQNENLFTLSTILAAFLSSFLVGILALKILLKILEQGKFYFFGIYCICIGIISILI